MTGTRKLSAGNACNFSGLLYNKVKIKIKESIPMTNEELKEALLRNHFEIVEMTQSGEWVSFTARKPAV